AESYQTQLAAVRDRSQEMSTSKARIEQERLQSKYNVANSIYGEMAKQLEQAKMQVKRDTPVLTIIQPVTVPVQPSNSRAKTLVIWTFLGFILGCGIVIGKGYLPKLKEMFAEKKDQ
ncbi:MAG: lipopolysaccharide biosynthesis protein, partial [Bacteroidales bacterium]|nr:lipopolysaccharide biosynthesis protein [Bacteroidales bacterium]